MRIPNRLIYKATLTALTIAALTGFSFSSFAENLASPSNAEGISAMIDTTGTAAADASATEIVSETTAASGAQPTLWVVGDSTAAEFSDNYYYSRCGWGTQLYRYFHDINIVNLAVSGASSKSYTETEQYQRLLAEMQAGDYLMIGFGHNDERAEYGRYTNPNESVSTPGSTQYSIYENYIRPAKEAGVNAVICTPIVRRDRGNNYSGESAHITSDQTSYEATFPGGDYGKAIRNVGVAKNVPVLDLTKRTKELYQQLGSEGTKYFHAWISSNEASIDNTHTNIYGAAYNAWLIADELQKTTSTLKNYLVEDPQAPDRSILTPNLQYQERSFARPSGVSAFWPSVGDWKGTVFGDIGGGEYLNYVYFALEPTDDNGIHLRAGRPDSSDETVVSVGKIGATTDGIAMYYQAIPADREFMLSADFTINAIDESNQVSFGLMARDDIYLDFVTNDTLGDYVAAGPLMMASDEPWSCFARKSGILTRGSAAEYKYQVGDEVHMVISKGPDGYTCTFGDNEPVSAGFDFPLIAVDTDYVYVGVFAARGVDVTIHNLNLAYN